MFARKLTTEIKLINNNNNNNNIYHWASKPNKI